MAQNVNTLKAIEFDFRVWDQGFFITVRIPYSDNNYLAVVAMRNSANIKLLRDV